MNEDREDFRATVTFCGSCGQTIKNKKTFVGGLNDELNSFTSDIWRELIIEPLKRKDRGAL